MLASVWQSPEVLRARSVRPAGAALVALSLLLAVSCSAPRRAVEDVIEERTEGTFYDAPDPVPAGEPGTIVRSERLLGAPDGARAWRILYRSTDLRGDPIVASGIVVAPDLPPIGGKRAVVSWAHPTTGAATRCAPSVGIDPFGLIEGIHELLEAGYVIAAADYSGMGTEGPASYLIGSTEAHNVLDAARAAQALDGAHAGKDLLLWGHSQGGQAALFAAQEATAYAPELDLHGVAVAAPAAELAELLDADIGDVSGVTIGAYAFDAFEEVYAQDHEGLDLTSVLTPEGAAAVPKMAPLCLFGQNKELHRIATPLIGRFLAHDPATTEPWATFLRENTPGHEPIEVPILVTQGKADALVVPETTDRLVERLCTRGEHVEYRTFDRITHALIAEVSVPELIGWSELALEDRSTPSNCPDGS